MMIQEQWFNCDMDSRPVRQETSAPPAMSGRLDASPFDVEFFMVQGLCFKGMAYCDDEGYWRSAYNKSQLMGHIYLLE